MSRILARCHLISALFLLSSILVAGPARAANEQVVREEKTVTINGVKETWRLVWEKKPAPTCEPDDLMSAMTCPCSGLAYGEVGHLSLVRSRAGREIDRMDLGPLFKDTGFVGDNAEEGLSYLQRRPVKDGDMYRGDDPKLVAEIERRPVPEIMKFADYNRDGAATEFLIQVGTLPCGKHQYAAVGVTKANPRLHALTSVAHPERPLLMFWGYWQALLRSPGPMVMEYWRCLDHGSDARSEIIVSAKDGKISVKYRGYTCPEGNEAEKFVSESDG